MNSSAVDFFTGTAGVGGTAAGARVAPPPEVAEGDVHGGDQPRYVSRMALCAA